MADRRGSCRRGAAHFPIDHRGQRTYDIARISLRIRWKRLLCTSVSRARVSVKSKEEFSNPYNWSGYVVGQILSKPEYMGHTGEVRSHKQSYKV